MRGGVGYGKVLLNERGEQAGEEERCRQWKRMSEEGVKKGKVMGQRK